MSHTFLGCAEKNFAGLSPLALTIPIGRLRVRDLAASKVRSPDDFQGMNRIHQFVRSLDRSGGHWAVSSAAVSVPIAGDPKGHATYTPLHHEPGYAYPLIVWLHDDGGNQHQLQRIMPLVSLRNYLGVAPRGTVVTTDGDGQETGYGWCQTDNHILSASESVLDCMDHMHDRFRIASSRVFLAGLGSGGTMAFRLALNHPSRFAGVISIGGPFPVGLAPLGRIDAARELPVLISGGQTARAYRDAQIADDLRLLHSAGMSVTLRLYPCGDELTTNMLSDVDRWVMQQSCADSCITDRPFEGDRSS